MVNLRFVLLIHVFFSTYSQYHICSAAFTNITSVKNEFITYENTTEGIKIDYPKGWTVIKQYGLAFLSPKENDYDTFREGLVVARGAIVNESIDKLADSCTKIL